MGEGDPYRVWLSEMMLQQTRVATVIPYYRRFLGRFPTLKALARAREDDVLSEWSGLGYYARGRALLRGAREAIQRHGAIPSTLEGLRALPGVGPYTAGAVASIAFGVPTAAVDGNAARVLSRIFLVTADSASRRFRERVWALAGRLVSSGGGARPGELNQAVMELGSLVCRPVGPRCERCPARSLCEARRTGREGSLPRSSRRSPSRPSLTLAVGVLTHRGRLLLVRREGRGLFAGTWAPPTVELEAGEDAIAAMATAIRREPALETGEFTMLGSVRRILTHRTLELLVHAAELERPPARAGSWRLVRANDLGRIAIAEAMRAALALAG